MGRPKGSTKENSRSIPIQVRLTAEEKAALELAAEAAHMPLSSFLRWCAMQKSRAPEALKLASRGPLSA